MLFDEDFKDFINSLNKADVRFLLVGGYAAIILGVNRTTGDMDILIEKEVENINKLIEAIDDFGMGSLGLEVADFLDNEDIVQIGISPIRIDILNQIPGINFDDAFNRSFVYEEENVKVNVIHINDLIRNKTIVGRDKDRIDVKVLNKILKKKK